jgi:hypothetical protein
MEEGRGVTASALLIGRLWDVGGMVHTLRCSGVRARLKPSFPTRGFPPFRRALPCLRVVQNPVGMYSKVTDPELLASISGEGAPPGPSHLFRADFAELSRRAPRGPDRLHRHRVVARRARGRAPRATLASDAATMLRSRPRARFVTGRELFGRTLGGRHCYHRRFRRPTRYASLLRNSTPSKRQLDHAPGAAIRQEMRGNANCSSQRRRPHTSHSRALDWRRYVGLENRRRL